MLPRGISGNCFVQSIFLAARTERTFDCKEKATKQLLINKQKQSLCTLHPA